MAPKGVRGSGEVGAVAVEFAIILPLLILILFGVFEFGLAWSQVQVFEGAAREGARCAAVQAAEASAGLDVCDPKTAVLHAAGSYTPSLTNFSAGVCPPVTDGREVTVEWDQLLELNIPFWPGGGSFSRHIEGTFRCE